MKPSVVHEASPDAAAGLRDAHHLRRGPVLVRREHHAERREHHVERRVGEGQLLGVGLLEPQVDALGLGAAATLLEQLGHVVGRRDGGEAARRGQRSVAIARRHVEDRLGREQVDGLAQRLADDLQGDSDPAEVSRRPRGLLLPLHGREVDPRWHPRSRRRRAGPARFEGHDHPPPPRPVVFATAHERRCGLDDGRA